jgi:hypothetical protein
MNLYLSYNQLVSVSNFKNYPTLLEICIVHVYGLELTFHVSVKLYKFILCCVKQCKYNYFTITFI